MGNFREDERKKMLAAMISDKDYRPMRLKEIAAVLMVPRE